MERSYYAAAATFLLIFVLHRLFMVRKKHQRLPPGPPLAFPVLGHLPLLKKPLQNSLADLAARYGPVLHLRLASRDAVVICSAELAKECFSGDRDIALANRPHFPSFREVSFDFIALGISNYGAHWRNMRRVATVHLLSAHRVNVMSDTVIAREVRAMVRRLARASSSDGVASSARVELKTRLFDLSHSVLMEIFAQTRNTYSGDADADMSEEAREMKGIIEAIVPLIGVANTWDHVPLLRWLDVSGAAKKLVEVVGRRNALIFKMIDGERRKLMERENGEAASDETKEHDRHLAGAAEDGA
ncbi:hypothetical protein PR202_ga08996 [Eleusine coracana subsp. coracana]|uniref:Uncharacterized protein n=1 Tax=Eleusine coracana subsp. coracana TaxID=191504 RepID=A0AAV5C1F5_ELECO|nr:hypothetical protein PR202_ga08996 [Eleusine coracana subsp. coracana]